MNAASDGASPRLADRWFPVPLPLAQVPPAGEAPGSAWLDQSRQLFFRAGCLLLRGLFEPDGVAQMALQLASGYAGYYEDRTFDDALRVGDRRTMFTPQLDGVFNTPSFYAHPTLLPLIQRLLGTKSIVGSFGAVVSLPGAADQHVHIDHPHLFDGAEVDPGGHDVNVLQRLLPPHAVTVLIPLVPLDGHRGTTRMWPGSHCGLGGHPADPVVSLGDAVLMDYRLVHGGTANRSDMPRPVLYLVYYRPWFRDCSNYAKQPRLLMSDEAYAAVPQAHRHMFVTRTG